jgi:hypothetical protein
VIRKPPPFAKIVSFAKYAEVFSDDRKCRLSYHSWCGGVGLRQCWRGAMLCALALLLTGSLTVSRADERSDKIAQAEDAASALVNCEAKYFATGQGELCRPLYQEWFNLCFSLGMREIPGGVVPDTGRLPRLCRDEGIAELGCARSRALCK